VLVVTPLSRSIGKNSVSAVMVPTIHVAELFISVWEWIRSVDCLQ
jgi:hypothetical protein